MRVGDRHLSIALRVYLDLLERVRHHGDEHVYEDDDGHGVVDHEHVLADAFGEGLRVTVAYGTQLGESEQRPEQGHVAL